MIFGNVTVKGRCTIGASNPKKGVAKVFQPLFLEIPPHPGGVWVKRLIKYLNKRFVFFQKKNDFRKFEFFKKFQSKIFKTFKFEIINLEILEKMQIC